MTTKRYFELKMDYHWACERRDARRKRAEEEDLNPDLLTSFGRALGLSPKLKLSYEDPEYLELAAEARRLQMEVSRFSSFLIRENLENFGIRDMTVTGVLYYMSTESLPGGGVRFHKTEEAGRAEMLLSDLCGLGRVGLVKQLGVKSRDTYFDVLVEKDGKVIGHVGSSFNYESAPDLRTALGWRIATDGGSERSLEFFNLDAAANAILDTIRTHGVEKNAFFDRYFPILERVFVDEHTTRYGDGYCGAATTMWRVATRELGEEHPGYPFGY